MTDLGVEMTEKTLEEINERIKRVYSEAERDLRKKAEEYTLKFIEKSKQKQADVEAGKITAQDYRNWLFGQVFIGKQWKSKVDQMARTLVHSEEAAVQVVRDGQLNVFADNANFMEYSIYKEIGFNGNFIIYDGTAVARLIAEEPELLRRRVVDGELCEAWNRKIIANCITQGIIQGESIDKIAKRMARDTASRDMKAMIRYARTAMTGAQNAGRQLAMEASVDQGITVLKVWIATLDERTRDAHADLDGQIVDVKEPFDSELGPIMYPGDPAADDANVWNCRCTLGYEYPDSPSKGQRYDQENGEVIDDMDYDEWVDLRKSEIKEKYKDLPLTLDGVAETKGYKEIEKYDIDANVPLEIDDLSMDAINNGAKAVLDDMPLIDKYLRDIAFGETDDGNPAMFQAVFDAGYPGLIISLNGKMWKSYERIKEFVVQQAENRDNINTDNPSSIITHEYGHAAFSVYAMKLSGYSGEGKITGTQWNAYTNSLFLIKDELTDIIRANGTPFLSNRAMYDVGEYVCEAFSDYYFGQRSGVSVDIVEYFKERLK